MHSANRVIAFTRIADTRLPDDVYERASRAFSPEELVYLTLAVSMINSWNRFSIAFQASPANAEGVFRWLQSQKAVSAAR